LNLAGTIRPLLRVLVCFPDDVAIESAGADLDRIAETLHWSLDADEEMELEGVWLGGNAAASLDAWLDALAESPSR